MSRVGHKIKAAREAAAISAKELGKKLGLSESFINDVEAGRKIINEDMIKRLEKVLKTSLGESLLDDVSEPVENIKEVKNNTVPNRQFEDAFSHILKKVPVCDINLKEIMGYKYLPIVDKKVEGFNGDKLVYINIQDDSMRGFRLCKNDRVLVFQNTELVSNSLLLIESEGKNIVRQIKRLDSNKVLVISHSNDIRTETKDAKSINVIGRCIKLETDL